MQSSFKAPRPVDNSLNPSVVFKPHTLTEIYQIVSDIKKLCEEIRKDIEWDYSDSTWQPSEEEEEDIALTSEEELEEESEE